jgi:hypothetical protein
MHSILVDRNNNNNNNNNSVVDIETRYGLEGSGIESR